MITMGKLTAAKPALLSLALAVAAQAATGAITNPTSSTTIWKDTAGGEIINNCGNILQLGGTFYWYGWDKYAKTVQVYTSTTLGSNSWQRRATLINDGGWHGRPDVIKHPSGTYVMIVACSTPNDPGRNGLQYYTSSSPLGPFALQLQENQVINGSGDFVDMGDKGIYQDDDTSQTAYLLCTTDDGGNQNGTTKIVKLNSNYIGQNSVMQSWTVTTNRREALAIFKRKGAYYLTSSGTYGWASTATWYKTSSSISGAFSTLAVVPTSPSSSDSFNTQHDFILKIVGTATTNYVYCGDRWSQDTGAGFGRNAWYHVTFDASGVPTINGEDTWTIDAATGVINGAPQTLTVAPAKDAMVKEAAATTNFGSGFHGRPGVNPLAP